MSLANVAADAEQVEFRSRHVAAAVIGNALEFFDFTAYAFFAIQIGNSFFPGHTQLDALILSLITLGVGFVGRPVGALVIGLYGDRVGRRPAMTLSFVLMCLGVLGLAVTPARSQIGVAAPILVLLARLVQGFALGGEVGPTTAFLIEAAPPARRGFFGSWQYASQCGSNLAAGVLGVILASALGPDSLQAWGWRVPFLLGAAMLPFGLYLRSSLPETLEPRERRPYSSPAERAEFRRALALGVPMLFSTTICFAMFMFLTTWSAGILHMPQQAAFGATVAWGGFGMAFNLIGGALSDRFGRKALMIWPRILLLLLILPGWAWIAEARSLPVLFAVTAVLTSLASLSNGVSIVCLTESIPKSVRSATLAIVYAIVIAAFNGTAQLLVTWLIKRTGDVLWPAYYLAAATAVGVVVMAKMRETAPGR